MTVPGEGGRDDIEPLRIELTDQPVAGGADASVPGNSTWRGWVGLAAAFALGAAISFVVADARHDASEATAVNIVIGGQQLRDGTPGELQFSLLNNGSLPVEVLEVVPDGWQPADADPPAVTVRPGEWETVATAAVVECNERPNATVHVTARVSGSTQAAEARLPMSGQNELLAFWQSACPTQPLDEMEGRLVEVVESGGDALTAVIELRPRGVEDQVKLVSVGAQNAGFIATSRDLPVELPEGQGTPVTIEWLITDCGQALQLAGARLFVEVATVNPREARIDVRLGEPLTLELARFSGAFCKS